MQYNRPIVLSIAGFDPSGGAGVLADVKTFEQHKCLGMGVISALTIQTENKFINVEWMSFEKMTEQLQPLLENYQIEFIKIGIIQNIEVLLELVLWIKEKNSSVKIIWDPVLAASSGFALIEKIDQETLIKLLKNIYLITPNTNEAIALTHHTNENDAAAFLAQYCAVLLKGGHSEQEKGVDYLYSELNVIKIIGSSEIVYSKHGSGCILSSAITSQLALGHSLEQACRNAKIYIENILKSNTNLLAYHVQ